MGKDVHVQDNILKLIHSLDGKVAITCTDESCTRIFSHNGNTPAPMQSVFKFPLALAILHEVDEGRLSLNHPVSVSAKDLLPDTWSPLRERNPNGGTFTLAELIEASVAESDNNACDILISLLGGTKKFNAYVQGILGDGQMTIVYTEKEMHEDTDNQYANATTSDAMDRLLHLFADEKILKKDTTRFLMNVMIRTKTGAGRIKGKLPPSIQVAHKTGSSGTDNKGMTAATNDVGIIFLPGKKRLFISVFVSDCKNDTPEIESVIAKITYELYQFKE